jgi:hypothetical protein
MIPDWGSGWNAITRGPGIPKFHVSNVSIRIDLLSGKTKFEPKYSTTNNYGTFFGLALLFSYILLLKHVQIR